MVQAPKFIYGKDKKNCFETGGGAFLAPHSVRETIIPYSKPLANRNVVLLLTSDF